ncbi:hypothetical protein [Lactobacillus huangpiensis]|uniref:hypothetical protein n=1 Tax=Lactobacillus huangpiensis TaxID=2799571 RepID=UPI001CC74BF4|nr:hypothetical protein [Lactobacillus huangpiensis]
MNENMLNSEQLVAQNLAGLIATESLEIGHLKQKILQLNKRNAQLEEDNKALRREVNKHEPSRDKPSD